MEYKAVYLNSARNCLKYIIKAFNIKEIHIPYYICPAIRSAILQEDCKINFYHIDKNFTPLKTFRTNDYIIYPNYWGICSNITDELSKKYSNLIIDNAHAFFAKPCGIASFNSLRKFFPNIRNGAILYTIKTLELELEQDTYTYDNQILTFQEICKNETMIEREPLKLMSVTTQQIFSKYNIEYEKQQRLNTFLHFHSIFGYKNQLNIKLNSEDIPFCYPFLADSIETAYKIVKELEDRNYLIFRYWNNLPDNFEEKLLYKQLIPIPLTTTI